MSWLSGIWRLIVSQEKCVRGGSQIGERAICLVVFCEGQGDRSDAGHCGTMVGETGGKSKGKLAVLQRGRLTFGKDRNLSTRRLLWLVEEVQTN